MARQEQVDQLETRLATAETRLEQLTALVADQLEAREQLTAAERIHYAFAVTRAEREMEAHNAAAQQSNEKATKKKK